MQRLAVLIFLTTCHTRRILQTLTPSNAKMFVIALVLISAKLAIGSLMLWSRKPLEISALGEFRDEDFRALLEKQECRNVVAFAGKDLELAKTISKLLPGRNTIYIPDAEVNFENVYGE